MKGLFITGTDTGVGKTLVACALTAQLCRRGFRVAVMKPAETGCALAAPDDDAHADGAAHAAGHIVDGMPGLVDAEAMASLRRLAEIAGPPPAEVIGRTPPASLRPADALRLRAASNVMAPLELINPYRFAPPVAPAVAAALAETPIALDALLDAMQQLASLADVIVVEGAGGALVPLSHDALFVDLIARSGLAAVVVARSTLGTINHTLLTLEALRQRDIPLAGVVLNRLAEHAAPEEASNPLQIERVAGDVVRGVMPYVSEAQRDDLDYLAQRVHVHVDCDAILAACGLPARLA
ncbi:MAG: dethiobiotin synthase [Myxococcales bacterium]|nr:dethiobiotin synthase [Myxococcales bacterium]